MIASWQIITALEEKMMTPADMKNKIHSVFDGMGKLKNVYRMLYKSPSQISLLNSQLSHYCPT